MESKGWWDNGLEEDWKREARHQVMQAFSRAEKALKPPIKDMFTDVYDKMSNRLQNQYQECMGHIAKYPHEYPTELYAEDKWGFLQKGLMAGLCQAFIIINFYGRQPIRVLW